MGELELSGEGGGTSVFLKNMAGGRGGGDICFS